MPEIVGGLTVAAILAGIGLIYTWCGLGATIVIVVVALALVILLVLLSSRGPTQTLASSDLTPGQASLLKWIVDHARNQTLPEEFAVYWSEQGPLLPQLTDEPISGDISRNITESALNALWGADFLICQPIFRNPREIRLGETEIGRWCALTAKAFDAAKSSDAVGPLSRVRLFFAQRLRRIIEVLN